MEVKIRKFGGNTAEEVEITTGTGFIVRIYEDRKGDLMIKGPCEQRGKIDRGLAVTASRWGEIIVMPYPKKSKECYV